MLLGEMDGIFARTRLHWLVFRRPGFGINLVDLFWIARSSCAVRSASRANAFLGEALRLMIAPAVRVDQSWPHVASGLKR
jgi:hypothetical protein